MRYPAAAWFSGLCGLQVKGPDWRHNSCGVGPPVHTEIIDVYLDLITIGIKQIETLGYPMVGSTLDSYTGINQFVARITQGLDISTDTKASMVKAPAWAWCRAGEATNLDQQQFMMGAPAGQSRCAKSRVRGTNLAHPKQVTVKSQ